MPRVFIESDSAPLLEIEAFDGGKLIDLCDRQTAPVPFSCRSASCGTCRIVVLEGDEQIAPAEDEELDILEIFGSPPHHRLACCAELRPGKASLRIRPARDDE